MAECRCGDITAYEDEKTSTESVETATSDSSTLVDDASSDADAFASMLCAGCSAQIGIGFGDYVVSSASEERDALERDLGAQVDSLTTKIRDLQVEDQQYHQEQIEAQQRAEREAQEAARAEQAARDAAE